MKLAIVAAFKAFVNQAKANYLESAIKTVEKNDYQVVSKEPKEKESK